jgi:hypothetical protein
MMRIIQGADAAHFVAERCGAEMFAEPYQAIGFTVDGRFAGGVVFTGFNGRNVDISVANDVHRWPVAFYRYFADYMWDTLGVHRVTMIVRPGNEKMCIKLGGKLEGMMREWYPDGSEALLFGLLKSEFKLDP